MRATFLILCISMLLFSCKEKEVDFSTEIKPLLNKKCIACHGGVKKQGGFSLLFEEEALAQLKSGKHGIVPGNPEASEMIVRLTAEDPEERMPYKEEPLNPEEIDLLKRWIKQGAKWGKHWAYEKVEVPEVPQGNREWAKNEIDQFISHKAKENGLQNSKEASPVDLARRVALDLVGFPVGDSLNQVYLQNPNDKTYEKYVDKLLASPHFGEKWTSMWLDLARYADTKGYERDDSRHIWPYRDWLIRAFNKDMPYNQFITEQLAGDLLPNPTEDQLLATAFHRNTMTNDEGGTDNEEFRTAAVIDRVNTTWETLMSTTFACVQCHSHPYDPFRHKEYYQFMAFFNNTRDADSFADYPVLRHFDESQKETLNQIYQKASTQIGTSKAKELVHFIKTLQPSINSLETDQFVNAELADTKWLAMRNKSSARLPKVHLENKTELILRYRAFINKGTLKIHMDSTKGQVLAQLNIQKPAKNWELIKIPLKNSKGKKDLFFVFESTELKDPLKTGIMFDWLHFGDGSHHNLDKTSQEKVWNLLHANVSQTPIMQENKKEWSRETHLFERGSWLSKGEKVFATTPAAFHSFENYPKNRLGLAQWITAKEHPLTSRTMVNRLWEQLFGKGLVETLEDMGTQGATPTHQALLDYLSYHFMYTDNWSIKKLLKRMVLSATYRQSSVTSPEHLEKDPFNIWLARGARVRLSAEQIRDQALAVTGQLNPEMFGPPVMPYQPDGVWLSPYNGKKWVKSEGSQQYRRALYTYWKRTSPYPSMINFDGVGREVCSSRRINTNTPLQALTTLNDSVFVDLAGQLAQRIHTGNTSKDIATAYAKITGKKISENRLKALVKLYKESISIHKKKEEEALAVCTNVLLNLDEVIMKN